MLCKRYFGGKLWCVAGDFNAISGAEERRGISDGYRRREIDGFNHFISKMNLVDVLVLGKKFLWWSGDGRS